MIDSGNLGVLAVHFRLILIVHVKCSKVNTLEKCASSSSIWVSVFTGLDYWNGIVEWNTGMENHAQNQVIRDMHACALVVHT